MFPTAVTGFFKNHRKFSNCSLELMKIVFANPNHQKCLHETIKHVCGNGIVEEGEECDPGLEDDVCCNKPGNRNPCKLVSGKECRLFECFISMFSPSQGPCCENSCIFKTAPNVCKQEDDCSQQATCGGTSAQCPTAISKADDILCNNKTGLCFNGVCSKSSCQLIGKTSCQYKDTCHFSCETSGTDDCKPIDITTIKTNSNSINDASPSFENKNLVYNPMGSPCFNENGFCSIAGICMISKKKSPLIKTFMRMINGDTRILVSLFFDEHTYLAYGLTAGYIFISLGFIKFSIYY